MHLGSYWRNIYSLEFASELQYKISQLTLNIGEQAFALLSGSVYGLWCCWLDLLFEVSVDVIHVVLEAS